MHLENTTCNCGLLQYSWKLLSTIKCLNRRLLPSKICTFALLLQYCRVNLKHHMAWVGSNYRQCWFYKQYPLCSATGIIHNGHQNYSSIQNVQLSEVVWHYALALWMPRCVTAFTAWSVRKMEWSKTADNGISLRFLCSSTIKLNFSQNCIQNLCIKSCNLLLLSLQRWALNSYTDVFKSVILVVVVLGSQDSSC